MKKMNVLYFLSVLFSLPCFALPDNGSERMISFRNNTIQAQLLWQKSPQLKGESILFVQLLDPTTRESIDVAEPPSLVL